MQIYLHLKIKKNEKSKWWKYFILEPHIAAESEQDIVVTRVAQEIREEEQLTTIGWEHLCFGDECMQLYILLFVLALIVCPFCSWLLKVLSCFWSCLLFCLWHGLEWDAWV